MKLYREEKIGLTDQTIFQLYNVIHYMASVFV